jgi:hypothetical protein
MTNLEKTETTKHVDDVKGPNIPFYEVKIKQGDTVLSITERYHGSLPTSIDQLIEDFEALNTDVKAEAILLGDTYRFPDYKE